VCSGSRITAPLILNPSTIWRWVAEFSSPPFTPGQGPRHPSSRSLGGTPGPAWTSRNIEKPLTPSGARTPGFSSRWLTHYDIPAHSDCNMITVQPFSYAYVYIEVWNKKVSHAVKYDLPLEGPRFEDALCFRYVDCVGFEVTIKVVVSWDVTTFQRNLLPPSNAARCHMPE
jgi:hypothetical protein